MAAAGCQKMGAFIPQVTFEGAYVNDDSSGMAMGAAVLSVSILMWRRGLGRWQAVGTGLALNLLALSKVDYYPTVLFFAGVACMCGVRGWRDGALPTFARRLGIVLSVAIITSGWRFARGLYLYADPIGTGAWMRRILAIAPGYPSSTLAEQGYNALTLLQSTPFAWLSFQSFWGVFDYMAVFLSPAVYSVLKWVVCLALAGLAVLSVRAVAGRGWRVERDPSLLLWLGLAALIALAIGESMWQSLTFRYSP